MTKTARRCPAPRQAQRQCRMLEMARGEGGDLSKMARPSDSDIFLSLGVTGYIVAF